jgi:integrase/recombinase XerD
VEYVTPQNQKLDVATRRNKLTAVKVFLRRMFELHYLKENPAARFVLPKRPRRLPEGILVSEELEAITRQTELHGDSGKRDKVIIETYYASAIRRAELSRLTLFDVDTKRFLLRVNKGKGQKDRVIPIAQRTCEAIEDYVANVRPGYVNFESGNVLFLNDLGKPFTPRQLSTLVKKYVMRAGVNRKGACNLYRHTAATGMLDNGADIRIIQEQLGHADVSTTQIYTHVSNKKLQEVYHQTHPAALK